MPTLLGRLEALIDNTRVTAPMDGTIIMVAIEPKSSPVR